MNLFNKKNELENNIKKHKKIISLSSTYESSNEEEYDEIIDNCLKEKRVNNDKKLQKEFKERKNRNIAINRESVKNKMNPHFYFQETGFISINLSRALFII